jgi:hypothetical protein
LSEKIPAPGSGWYKHFRYRLLAANPATYPFYANVLEDFERRLDEAVRKLPPMTSKVKLPMVTFAMQGISPLPHGAGHRLTGPDCARLALP